jgi:hypothetical protein
MSDENVDSLDWSAWLDYKNSGFSSVPESPGVYKMHTGMQILYIGSGNSLKESLQLSLSDPCINQAKRFSYALTSSPDRVKDQLLVEYRSKHDGRLPACMEKNQR